MLVGNVGRQHVSPIDVRVDRSSGSSLGNPFVLGQSRSRWAVCEACDEAFAAEQPGAVGRVAASRGWHVGGFEAGYVKRIRCYFIFSMPTAFGAAHDYGFTIAFGRRRCTRLQIFIKHRNGHARSAIGSRRAICKLSKLYTSKSRRRPGVQLCGVRQGATEESERCWRGRGRVVIHARPHRPPPARAPPPR